jgi:Cd2+/Zn2+-exporting ATPase
MTDQAISLSVPPVKPLRTLIPRERLEVIFVVLTAVCIGLSLFAESQKAPAFLILLLNIASYVFGGTFGLMEGIESLSKREINVDTLMVLAAIGAALVNQWHEGATLLFLFSLSEVLQTYAMDRSRNAIKALLKLRPETATVRRESGIVSVPTQSLTIGDVVVIRPGERLPVDGEVIAGESAVDQAPITGESMPVTKQIGDEVFAGTVNQHGTLDVRMTRPANQTTLSRIITMVEEAQGRRAETQRFLDEFEEKYAKLVIAAVALYIVIPPLFFSVPFSQNFYRAMVLMTVASPCALVISTPASILSAIANAARRGILFKGGAYLEQMGTIKAVAFDKTGTITTGKPAITDLIPLNNQESKTLLSLTALAEFKSEHPIAKAILAEAKKQGIAVTEPAHFEAIPGQGVKVRVQDDSLTVGTERLMISAGLTPPSEVLTFRDQLESEGKTVLIVHSERIGWVGLIAVADQIRENAAEILKLIRSAGVQHIAILTGDNRRTADAVGKRVGADQVYAELLPEHKVDVIRELKGKYGQVAMVGDGVNDAPALADATVGIAMGAAGTDVALETADVVLMADDLASIAYAIKLSRKARRVVLQNLTFALGVIVVLVISALGLNPLLQAGQELPLPVGVIGHEGSTLIVVMNGIRLLVENDRTLLGA